jgi:hypothetical protein
MSLKKWLEQGWYIKIRIKMNRKRLLIIGLMLLVFNVAYSKQLGLNTTPALQGAGNDRYTVIEKEGTVTFTASPEGNPTLTWEFSNANGQLSVTKKGPGPHALIYKGEHAEGNKNPVRFSSTRKDGDDTCKTDNKLTCMVIVPKVIFKKMENFWLKRIG